MSLERETDAKVGKKEVTTVKDGEKDKREVEVEKHEVEYAPGESNSEMFGGNSNWRGPIWICSEHSWYFTH